ncbi:hypothetical protein UlMin_033636 [Ulmus minor]
MFVDLSNSIVASAIPLQENRAFTTGKNGIGGMLPKSKASPKVIENYEAQEKYKRKKLLQTYIDACSAAKIKVKLLLVESDMAAKAILDLIPTFNIKKISKRNGIASKIIQNVPDSCDVKIITNNIQVIDQFIGSPTSRSSSTTSLSTQDEELITLLLRGSLPTMINYANLSNFRSSSAFDHKRLSNKIETCGRNDSFSLTT